MKKKFIVYTDMGYTTDPEGDDVENAQVLGWSEGYTPEHAIACLFDDNPNLEKLHGFVRCGAIAQEVV